MRAETERRVEEAYAKLLSCTDDELRIAITADVILCVFDEFYCQLCGHEINRAGSMLDMQFKNDYARRCFRQVNRDLMTIEYWTRVQEMLKADELPELRVYPESAWLRDAAKAEA